MYFDSVGDFIWVECDCNDFEFFGVSVLGHVFLHNMVSIEPAYECLNQLQAVQLVVSSVVGAPEVLQAVGSK